MFSYLFKWQNSKLSQINMVSEYLGTYYSACIKMNPANALMLKTIKCITDPVIRLTGTHGSWLPPVGIHFMLLSPLICFTRLFCLRKNTTIVQFSKPTWILSSPQILNIKVLIKVSVCKFRILGMSKI